MAFREAVTKCDVLVGCLQHVFRKWSHTHTHTHTSSQPAIVHSHSLQGPLDEKELEDEGKQGVADGGLICEVKKGLWLNIRCLIYGKTAHFAQNMIFQYKHF